MLQELERYAAQKRQGGNTWDGNVPTNYKITVERVVNGRKTSEEKNLGRWVNRQRSLYQSGKLKEDRQFDLERVGLRWSVLSVASWSAMFNVFLNYVREQKAQNNGMWDGNVPASFRVESKPPVNLGRWVNRQRCAYAKNRLKHEFVVKLEQAGLKWSMHEKSGLDFYYDDDFEGEEFIPKEGAPGGVLSSYAKNVQHPGIRNHVPSLPPLPPPQGPRSSSVEPVAPVVKANVDAGVS